MRSSEQIKKRRANTAALLMALYRHGPRRRADLARDLGLRPNSVGAIVADLLRRGILELSAPDRPRSPIALCTRRLKVRAGLLTPGRLLTADVDLTGRMLAYQEAALPTESPARTVQALGTLFARPRTGGSLWLGVGLATPGLVDSQRGICHQAVNLGRIPWRDVALAEPLAARLRCPVLIENNVRAALWSASWFDANHGANASILYLVLDEGVACASLVNGRLITGVQQTAGEIGHVRVGNEGRPCHCGRADCLEAYVSIPALERALLGRAQARVERGAARLAAATAHARPAQRLAEALTPLGRTLAPLMAALQPDTLIVSTPDATLSAWVAARLDALFRASLLLPPTALPRVQPGAPPALAALQGVAGWVQARALADGLAPGFWDGARAAV